MPKSCHSKVFLLSCTLFIYKRCVDKAKEITIYRCLRSNRVVNGHLPERARHHDECADIIARNPSIIFESGLSGVEVDHLIYEGTNWDIDRNGWPEKYLIHNQGRLGHILVSFRLKLGRVTDVINLATHFGDPSFYLDPHLLAFGNTCYKAGNTSLIRVRIEKIVNKPL